MSLDDLLREAGALPTFGDAAGPSRQLESRSSNAAPAAPAMFRGSAGPSGSSATAKPAEHVPGSALHLIALIGARNIFPSQRLAFERCDNLNRASADARSQLAPPASTRQPGRGHPDHTKTPPAIRRRRATERKEALAEVGRVAVFCIESDEPLVHVSDFHHHPSSSHDDVGGGGGQHQHHHQQTRFFIVATASCIAEYAATVPPAKQHLYEVIREGEPCFFYLDVEVDPKDISRIPPAVAAAATEGLPTPSDKLLVEHRCCPMSCDRGFDGGDTTARLLVRELSRFLQETVSLDIHPLDVVVLQSMDPQRAVPKYSLHIVVRPIDSADDDAYFFPSNAHVGAVVAAFVHALYQRARTEPEIHQGLFYHGFRDEGKDAIHVQTAAAAPAADTVTAAAGDEEEAGALATVAVPVQPLKCLVDEAVYSRNRMFRCLGSRKLGKTASLDVSPIAAVSSRPAPPQRAPMPAISAWLLHTLVACGSLGIDPSHVKAGVSPESCVDAFHAVLNGVAGAAARAALRAITAVERMDAVLAGEDPGTVAAGGGRGYASSGLRTGVSSGRPGGGARLSPAAVPKTCAWVAKLATTQANTAPKTGGAFHQRTSSGGGGPEAFVTSVLAAGDSTLLLAIGGRRYCANANREHKSNGVYFVVSKVSGHATQRCHDPDCFGRSSEPFPLPADVASELHAAVVASPSTAAVVEAPAKAPAVVRPAEGLLESNARVREDFKARCTRFVPPPRNVQPPPSTPPRPTDDTA